MAVTGGTVDMKTAVGFPFPQGCTVEGQTANFSVAVPEGQTCELIIYKKGARASAFSQEMPYSDVVGNLHFLSVVLEQPEDYEYCYKIGGKIVPDPYGKAFSGREHWSVSKGKEKRTLRTRIVTDTFDWGKSQFPHLKKEDVIAYSLHVRGFTKHSSSGVAHKGTFDGVTEKLPYLQKLGINQIHLMPVYEFDENQRHVNYWGYGKAYFFAPKASYAAGDPVNEMKSLVRQMHLAGIEVLMDIYFRPGTNLYLMTDCLRHWVINYHIDGFRVNQEVMPAISLVSDPIISGVKLLTSYWDENMLRDTGALNDNVLAEYNEGFMNDARRFLKSDEGMVQTFSERFKRNAPDYSIINFITHVNGFTMMDLVSYDIKHNESNGENNNDGTEFNYSWNCGIEGKTRKRAVMRSRMNQIRNAFTMLLCSQGTPMLLAGDEFGNTQLGNNNAYCHDDNITWLNWKHTKSEQDIFEFVKRMIAFRKQHCVLHGKEPLSMFDTKGIGIPDMSVHGTQAWRADFSNYSRMLGILLGGRYGITEDDDIYIAFNMFWEQKVFELPNPTVGKKWYPAIDTHSGEFFTVPPKKKRKRKIKSEKQLFREYLVEPRSIVVFVGR